MFTTSISCNGGSKTLSEILNRFGIIPSLNTYKVYMNKIVNEKIENNFEKDLDLDTFCIASLDNLDIDTPFAHFNHEKRGIHATSVQALFPKPTSLKHNCDAFVSANNLLNSQDSANTDTITNSLTEMDSIDDIIKLCIDEEDCISILKTHIFTYMLEKLVLSESKLDTVIGNVKERLYTFSSSTTEKAKVIYLGVSDLPCDNIFTVKHVLQDLHQKFKVGVKLKHLIVVGDGKTYEYLCKLQLQYKEELSWMVPFPGD